MEKDKLTLPCSKKKSFLSSKVIHVSLSLFHLKSTCYDLLTLDYTMNVYTQTYMTLIQSSDLLLDQRSMCGYYIYALSLLSLSKIEQAEYGCNSVL